MVKIILDPNYTGSMLIKGFVHKTKDASRMSRLFKTYNKRYIVLDLNQMLFYYGNDEKANLASSRIIKLLDI